MTYLPATPQQLPVSHSKCGMSSLHSHNGSDEQMFGTK